MNQPKSKMLTLRVTEQTAEGLEQEAQNRRRQTGAMISKSDVARELIEQGLEQIQAEQKDE